jgi:hypothetical protein
LYSGRIGIELFKGAMISRPSDRLGLFAILVNEAANYSTKPASSPLWLTEAAAGVEFGLNGSVRLKEP